MLDWFKRSFSPIEQPDPGGWRTRQAAAQRAAVERTQTRAIDSFTSMPGLTEQLLAVQGLSNRPWRVASVREALGVPSNFRSVALISNTTGSLAMEAYRKGVLLDDEDMPRIVKRPDPFRIPRDFFRDTAFDQATRGEYWWWVAARGADNEALSLIRIAPWEIRVEQTDDRLRPRILWGNREMRREDMIHGTFLPDPNEMSGPWQRGVGPLQLCGAAISVQVESDQWAANFFVEDGGYPSIVIKAAGELGVIDEGPDEGKNEADVLRDQWMSKPNRTPRVVDDGVEDVKEFSVNSEGAALLETRESNKGMSANLFGVPGALLEYGRPGSSLTYQTVTEVFTTFVRATLAPDYLESIEQNMSDLLPRSTIARFNVKGFERADIKTRWEVYKLAVDVIGQQEAGEIAREQEGITPGDIEFAPVPFAPPNAVPASLPVTRSAEAVRCNGRRILKGNIRPCNALLAEAPPFIGKCRRCGKVYEGVAA